MGLPPFAGIYPEPVEGLRTGPSFHSGQAPTNL